MQQAITFDDVLMVPSYNDFDSRKDVDISMSDKTGKLALLLPVITSNMDTITEYEMANFISSKGGAGALHRFMSIEENVEQFKKCVGTVFVSVGTSQNEMARVEALKAVGATNFLVDVAHGHAKYVGKMIKRMREYLGSSACIMAGNVATYAGADYLAACGADIIKVGIGPGCFAAGTRVLMSDGFYKNIEEIQVGERVINMFGKPVEVKKSFSTGYRKICKYRHSHSHKFTYATPDHKHFVGDCNTVSESTLKSSGYVDILNKETKKEESKFKWKALGDLKQDVLLFPEKIELDICSEFKIDLKTFSEKCSSIERFCEDIIKPSYNLGYVFGLFLGDGTSRVFENGSGAIHFYLNISETNIAEKLTASLKNIFGIKAKTTVKNDSVLVVTLYSKVLALLFAKFGKQQEKSLPKEFLVSNYDYIKGIYDGLIDSGHISSDDRAGFSNTSEKLTELFNVISVLLGKGHPQYTKPLICSSAKVKGKNRAYKSRLLIRPEKRVVNGFLVSKILEQEIYDLDVKVYDIELDCPTHSFIANGAIVHNSVCTTRIKTGFGVPQLTAIQECSKVDRSIVADGGLKTSGDIVKALAFGADFVMIGSMLSGTRPTPGKVHGAIQKYRESDDTADHGRPYQINDGFDYSDAYKIYRGMASKEVADDHLGGLTEWKTAEGVSTKIPYSEKESEIIADIIGGLRSGLTYGGAGTIKELQRKLNYKIVTPAGRIESLPHKIL